MIRPLPRTGHSEQIRKTLASVFLLQNRFFVPSGRFHSLEGAVGTTGPRWICATGAALTLTADYYNYTRDERFLKDYLESILKAADWITGEIRATRKTDSDGKRPPGLMPFGRGADGTNGCHVTFTDGYGGRGLIENAHFL